MPLTPEQITELKNQLREQVKNLPESQRAQAESQINEISSEAIESMLAQQKASQKPIFRSIISNEIPSKKIDENKIAIAVLDTRPISNGHTIIIPKSEIKDGKNIPFQAFSLGKKVAKRISNKLKAKSVEIQTEFKFGEIILNLIPIYDKPLSLNSQRQEIPEPQLTEFQNLLKAKPKVKREEKQKTEIKQSNLPQLKRRIP
jgi:histidine triad (HIT) family protein